MIQRTIKFDLLISPILEQLSTRNWHYCAVFIKSEIIFSNMPHIVAFPGWSPLTLRFLHGSQIETCFNFSEKVKGHLKFVRGQNSKLAPILA